MNFIVFFLIWVEIGACFYRYIRVSFDLSWSMHVDLHVTRVSPEYLFARFFGNERGEFEWLPWRLEENLDSEWSYDCTWHFSHRRSIISLGSVLARICLKWILFLILQMMKVQWCRQSQWTLRCLVTSFLVLG